ncbi:hypothetical protein [Streptomyces sp. NPDC060194]|uniref:hypothetical protein n=1 Tax=Streptomyces sp. NPDC060194 TaxID=3347069 RepID=UPI003651537B
MFVFICRGCGAELTAPVSQVPLPAHARQSFGNGVRLPVLMEPGTFAVDPEVGALPFRSYGELRPSAAAGLGPYALVPVVSGGVHLEVVVAPGDARNTVLVPERAGGYCCGPAGADGPNMACASCGLPVASRVDDCSLWQAVWLAPDAVRCRRVDAPEPALRSWAELVEEGGYTPPFEPFTSWGDWGAERPFWSWSPRWEAAAGVALAHLVAASQGRSVTVPDGLCTEVFRRALDALLPSGPARRAVPAGPGRTVARADAEIALVPVHPRTGETWAADGVDAVPLPFGVWLWLAVPPRDESPIRPATGGLPPGVLRDDPPAPRSPYLFRPDARTFERALTRLPPAPWLHDALARIPELHTAGVL